jgi:hypothetical protein
MATKVVAFSSHTNAFKEHYVAKGSTSVIGAPTKVGDPSAHGAEAARLKHEYDESCNVTHSANMVEAL